MILNIFGFLSTALCIGGMVFFAILVAPLVFIHLDEKNAGKLIRAIFPWYYLYVIITAAISTGVYIFQFPIAAAGFALATLSSIYARQNLINKINRARDSMLAGEGTASDRFDKLHKLSVRLNGISLFAVIFSAIYLGIRTN